MLTMDKHIARMLLIGTNERRSNALLTAPIEIEKITRKDSEYKDFEFSLKYARELLGVRLEIKGYAQQCVLFSDKKPYMRLSASIGIGAPGYHSWGNDDRITWRDSISGGSVHVDDAHDALIQLMTRALDSERPDWVAESATYLAAPTKAWWKRFLAS